MVDAGNCAAKASDGGVWVTVEKHGINQSGKKMTFKS